MLGNNVEGQVALGEFVAKFFPTVTIPSTVRINGMTFDKNGSPVIWYIDTATGLAPVNNLGQSINPFTSS